MKYVDSVKDLGLYVWNNFLKRREVTKACNQLIKHHEQSIDFLRTVIEDTEKQVKWWEDEMKKNPAANYANAIDVFKVMADFYRLNGRLALIELDVNTAYKNIFKAKTEYEYRFFARRIYTLMYEAEKGLAIPTGQMYPELSKIVDAHNFDPYKKQHKALTAFLKSHKDEFEHVRNSNEAHKFRDFEIQLESIENFSVKYSIGLIQEFQVLLAQLNVAFMIVNGALSAYLHKMMVKKNSK